MTTKQVMESVAALGFESDIIEKELFFSSANRALSLIFTDREITKTVKVSRETPDIVSYVPSYRHNGKSYTLPLRGRAYSFTSTGVGKCTVRDGYHEYSIDLSGNMSEHRGFLSDGGDITFFGEYAFTVYHLTCFAVKMCENVSDIPIYDGDDFIDFGSMYGDFLAFTSLPTDGEGKAVKGVCVSDGRIYLPRDVSGELTVRYRRTHKNITSDNLTGLIDLPRECEVLLPLLTASFMWLDDDAEKAQYYMALYRDTLGRIDSTMTSKADAIYTTNGWA